jgi:hypothetical protein
VEIADRLRRTEQKSRGDFAAVHVADNSLGVPDNGECRLVILHPKFVHARKDDDFSARKFAQTVLDTHGKSQRTNRNMVVLLAGDAKRMEELNDSVREYLAWANIAGRRNELNLGPQQGNQVETRKDEREPGRRPADPADLPLGLPAGSAARRLHHLADGEGRGRGAPGRAGERQAEAGGRAAHCPGGLGDPRQPGRRAGARVGEGLTSRSASCGTTTAATRTCHACGTARSWTRASSPAWASWTGNAPGSRWPQAMTRRPDGSTTSTCRRAVRCGRSPTGR